MPETFNLTGITDPKSEYFKPLITKLKDQQ
jgi:hypothetical protein